MYVYESPHKDGNARMCTCVSVFSGFKQVCWESLETSKRCHPHPPKKVPIHPVFPHPTTSSHLNQPVKEDLSSHGTVKPTGREWDPSIHHHRAPGPACTASSTHNLGEENLFCREATTRFVNFSRASDLEVDLEIACSQKQRMVDLESTRN